MGKTSLPRQLGLALSCVCSAAVLLLAPGCGHNPIERTLDNPAYYFDNALPFQPNRIWRLKVRWEPYLLDDKKAMVVKQYQLVVHGDNDRRRLDAEIDSHGGDRAYLRWFESELFPLGNWEEREEAHVARLRDMTIVSLRTKALKEVPKKGFLTVAPVWFPDPLFRALTDGCHELNWDVISRDESVGVEVVLESREVEPQAEKWQRRDFDSPVFWWRQWSVGQKKSIAYRTAIYFKTNVARCPIPPKLHEQFKIIRKAQAMGVEW